MRKKGFLVIFHTPSNAGYAMSPLEKTFFRMACTFTGSSKNVHFAYSSLSSGKPETLPEGFENIVEFSYGNITQFQRMSSYISEHNIAYAFCFDLQVNSPACKLMRAAGVETIFSYWGSTISGLNRGVKLLMKRIEVFLRSSKPNHFIFESEAMQHYAVNGRGINHKNTSVIATGIDTDKYSPLNSSEFYLQTEFGIPEGSFVLFYSGHMEKRKGVQIIIDAMRVLVDDLGLNDVYCLITGNREGEELPFIEQLQGSGAIDRVVFGGYRKDLDSIMPECDVGVIASIGWDSFPMSSLEMASCGLPLVVSRLQGLVETIVDGETGYLFEPGDSFELAGKVEKIYKSELLQKSLGSSGRARIVKNYSTEIQLQKLQSCLEKIVKA
jgi:Glycosyltransferase